MLNNPYLVALGIPLVLLLCGAVAKKLVRRNGWRRTDFFLGLELALAAIGSAMVYFYDLQKMNMDQAVDNITISTKIGATATFLAIAFMNQESRIRIVSLVFLITSFIAMAMSARGYEALGARPTLTYFSVSAALLAAALTIYGSRRSQPRNQSRVFIMYSHADQAAACDLVRKLKAEGYNPWFDLDEIAPGQKIQERIQNGLGQSSVALLLVSKRLDLDNSLINKELHYAMESLKPADASFSPVIPVRLDDAEIPAALAGISWIDLREENAFERLDLGLKRMLAA